jgi:hypothetical protein
MKLLSLITIKINAINVLTFRNKQLPSPGIISTVTSFSWSTLTRRIAIWLNMHTINIENLISAMVRSQCLLKHGKVIVSCDVTQSYPVEVHGCSLDTSAIFYRNVRYHMQNTRSFPFGELSLGKVTDLFCSNKEI